MRINESASMNPSHLSQRARQSGGQPITKLMSKALANPQLISLAAGFVDEATLPISKTNEAVQYVLSSAQSGQAALQYGLNFGNLELRQAILNDFAFAEHQLAPEIKTAADLGITVDQTIVTAGSNQLLHLLFDSMLNPGDIVLCCAPTYFVVTGTLASLGGRAVGVATDEQGMISDSLEQAIEQIEQAGELSKLKAIYVVSYYDNPTGRTTSLSRRKAIVDITKKWSQKQFIHIVEDAAYRDIRYEGPDLPSLRSLDDTGKHVIFTGTFSKSFAPGIRVGWGFLPEHLIGPVADLKGNIDFGSPNLSQCIMADVMKRGEHKPHAELLQKSYQLKRDAMLAALDTHLGNRDDITWVIPGGGLYVWLELPSGMDAGLESKLFDNAVNEGMIYVPGEFCFPAEGEPVRHNTIRLSFGVQDADGIEKGIAALARAISKT